MAQITPPVQLKQQTLNSFSSYVRDAEAVMEQSLGNDRQFLWSDINPERVQRVRGGEVLAQFWSGHGPVKVPDGLIHDWIGASCMLCCRACRSQPTIFISAPFVPSLLVGFPQSLLGPL